jgi:hypothetical protein
MSNHGNWTGHLKIFHYENEKMLMRLQILYGWCVERKYKRYNRIIFKVNMSRRTGGNSQFSTTCKQATIRQTTFLRTKYTSRPIFGTNKNMIIKTFSIDLLCKKGMS